MPCTLVRLVQFSKVFVTHFSQVTTILVYHSRFRLSTLFETFFKTFFSSSVLTATYHSPYGIRTRVTAVKRRCLNPLTNGPELLFSTLTIIPTFYFCQHLFNFLLFNSFQVHFSNYSKRARIVLTLLLFIKLRSTFFSPPIGH